MEAKNKGCEYWFCSVNSVDLGKMSHLSRPRLTQSENNTLFKWQAGGVAQW